MIDLQDIECIHDQGVLHKYIRKSNGQIFSVKTVIAPENMKPEEHPLIVNLKNLAQYTHKTLPTYYGFASKKGEGFQEILIFFEDSEGALEDYLKVNNLDKDEIVRMVHELIDVLIYIDRNAYILPAVLTPYNILVVRNSQNKIQLKIFGVLPFDEKRKLTNDEMKFAPPELYEKINLKRTHININAEKAVFYSLGVLTLYCATKDLITEGRSGIVETSHFTTTNQERETQASAYARTKIANLYNDRKLNEILEKILIYNAQERPDFRIFQHMQKDAQTGGGKGAKQQKSKQTKNSYAQNNGGVYQDNNGKGEGKKKSKKNACCDCTIF